MRKGATGKCLNKRWHIITSVGTHTVGCLMVIASLSFNMTKLCNAEAATIPTESNVIWDNVGKAEEEDLEILRPYMDETFLSLVLQTADSEMSVGEILQSYCEYDQAFVDVLRDYFI